jgi:hypothetical protein
LRHQEFAATRNAVPAVKNKMFERTVRTDLYGEKHVVDRYIQVVRL